MIHFSLPGKCGDVILSTPALGHWLTLYPDADVVFWTQAESAWVYRRWKRVQVRIIDIPQIQIHFKEWELIPFLKAQGADQVICLNAWPDKLDVFSRGINLLTSFFEFAGLPVPPPPYRLNVPVHDHALKRQVTQFANQLGSPFVIISRHCHSITNELTDKWWSHLVKKLNRLGFAVLDNIAGSETALRGTIPLVNWPYPNVLLLSRLAKATIAVRSGLTDVVAAGGGRLISLIPQDSHRHLAYSAFKLEGDIVDIIHKSLPPQDELIDHLLAGNKKGIATGVTY